MSFLNAKWKKLAFANYIIEPELLKDYIPKGTELDLWNNNCYISLVGFMFQDTKLLGYKIPFHINFEEVNLRFYVKRYENGKWKRGVVFIKEIVPKFAITLVANTIYKENYETLPMKHLWAKTEDTREVEYQWKKGNKWQTFNIKADLNLTPIEPGSETEFITEHYWGYAKHKNSTNEYEVIHPKWEQYKVNDFTISVDFELTYGKEFSVLNNIEPASVMLTEGSEISVENKITL